jgi:hypothetical protein
MDEKQKQASMTYIREFYVYGKLEIPRRILTGQ